MGCAAAVIGTSAAVGGYLVQELLAMAVISAQKS